MQSPLVVQTWGTVRYMKGGAVRVRRAACVAKYAEGRVRSAKEESQASGQKTRRRRTDELGELRVKERERDRFSWEQLTLTARIVERDARSLLPEVSVQAKP